MDTHTRPGFFCSRPNGTLTPLIAADELPPNVSIRGVPRTLTLNDTQGMTSCGVAPVRTEPWVVDEPTSVRNNNLNDLTELSSVLFKILRDENVSSGTRALIHGVLYRQMGGPQANTHAGPNVMAPSQAIVPAHHPNNGHNNGHFKSGPPHHNGKKEYCSYWIRHGECDYSQQGCLFKHEMPTDPELLERLGLREIPRWYREKYGVPGVPHPNYGSNQLHLAANEQPMRAIQYNVAGPHEENIGSTTNYNRGTGHRYKSPRGNNQVSRDQRGAGWPKVLNHHFQSNQNAGSKNGGMNTPPSDETFSAPTDNKFDVLRGEVTDGRETKEEGGVALSQQHILDQNDPIDNASLKGLEKQAFRSKSRRLFERNLNQGHANPAPANVTNDIATPSKAHPNNVPGFPAPRQGIMLPRPMMAELLKDSEPIYNNAASRNWGEIGEPVNRRPSAESQNSYYSYQSGASEYLAWPHDH